jgi:hypothetical protein
MTRRQLKRTLALLIGSGYLIFLAGPKAIAQTTTPTTAKPADSSVDTGWHVAVSPYLWLSGIKGTVGSNGLDVRVDAGFGDLFSNVNFGLMAASEIRRKRLLLLGDLMWIKLSDDKGLPENRVGITSANAETKNFMLSPGIGYRLVQERLNVDAYTGFRYWHLGSSLEFKPNPPGPRFDNGYDWADPLLGMRFQAPLGAKARFTLLGDVGGFGAGSQLEWQIAPLLGYDVGKSLTLQAGYRYMDIDYRSGGFKYDVAMNGMLLGLTIRMK